MNFKTPYILPGIFCLTVCFLSFFALINYPGHTIIYTAFTIVLNALFVFGFTKDKIYFDTFIGIFFWLGFWVKYSLRVAFLGGAFQAPELIGKFSGTGAEHDHALLVVSCGISGLLIASLIRRRFFFSYVNISRQARLESIFTFYQRYRKSILALFLFPVRDRCRHQCDLRDLPEGDFAKNNPAIRSQRCLHLALAVRPDIRFGSDTGLRIQAEKESLSCVAHGHFGELFFKCINAEPRDGPQRRLVDNRHASITPKSVPIHPCLRYKLVVLIVFVALFVCSVFVANHVRKHLFYSDFPAENKYFQVHIRSFQ